MKRALVLSLIFAVGLGFAGFAQTLSGTWDTDVILDLTALTWADAITINTELLVDYTVGDWTFSSETDISNGAWANQDFDFAGVLGAFTIGGSLEFDPDDMAHLFDWLNVDVSVSIAGVTFGADFYLFGDNVYLDLTASGVAGDVTIDVEVEFGEWYTLDELDGCDFDFNGVTVGVEFPFCCATISSELYLSCAGFEYIEFCMTGLTIENLPWLTLDACIQFQTMSKTFAFRPQIDLGLIGCDFDLFYRLATDPEYAIDTYGDYAYGSWDLANGSFLLDGIIFDGLQIACEIGGVSFTGITYFGPGIYGYGYSSYDMYFPGILYGYEGLYNNTTGEDNPGPFYEAYQIATTDDGCCGPFSFDVTVFFDMDSGEHTGSGMLFDVAWVSANVEIQLASQFTFGMGLETDIAGDTVDELTFTFEVTW